MATRSKAKSISSNTSVSSADDIRASFSQGSHNDNQNERVVTGNGTQLVWKEKLPVFDDQDISWAKYAEEFELHIMEQEDNEDIDIRTHSFTTKRNRQIYKMLVQGIGRKSFDLICKKFKFLGQEAFLFLEDYYLGTAQLRKEKIFHELTSIKLNNEDSIKDFGAKILNWEVECISYGLLPSIQKEGEMSILGSLVLRALPPRMHSFVGRVRERSEGPPSVKELVRLMIAEDNQQNFHKSTKGSQNIVSIASTSNPAKNRGNKRKWPKKKTQKNKPGSTTGAAAIPGAVNSSRENDDTHHLGQGNPPAKQRRITCNKCKSTNNSHTERDCWSNKWCDYCQSASHNRKFCRKARR